MTVEELEKLLDKFEGELYIYRERPDGGEEIVEETELQFRTNPARLVLVRSPF